MLKKVLLLLVLCLTFTGCAQDEATQKETTEVSGGAVSGEGTEKTSAVVDRSELEMNYQESDYLQIIGDTCYYIRHEQGEDDGQISVLYCRKVGDGEEEIIHTYNYNREENESYLDYTCCGADGSWYNLWRVFAGVEASWYLEKLDASGSEVFHSELPEEWGHSLRTEFIQDAAVSANGEFCVMTEQNTVLLWDNQGKELGMLDASSAGISSGTAEVVTMTKKKGVISAGTAGLFLYQSDNGEQAEQKIAFVPINLEEVTLEKTFVADISETAGGRIAGLTVLEEGVAVYGGYEAFCYLATEDSLWKCLLKDNTVEGGSMERGSVEKLFNWLDPYISVDRNQLVGIGQDGESMIFLCYDAALETTMRLKVENQKLDELAEKTVITLGYYEGSTAVLENLQSVVQEYNSQSERFSVEIRSYQSDGYQGMDELTMALLQGEGPDLFDLSGLSMEYYSAKGVMEDLNPYLESSGIQLLESVEKALKKDGKVYALADQFTIKCIVLPQGYSTHGGVGLEQCMEMVKAYPEAYVRKNANKFSYLSLLLEVDMDSYVDIQEGTCSFDSEEFISLLEAVSSWEDAPDAAGYITTADEIYNKEYLLAEVSILEMSNYLVLRRAFGEFACIAGYPNQAGEARYCMELTDHYAMNSASENKEGAWDFLQYLLSDTAQKKADFFPVTKDAFEEAIREKRGENYYYISPYTGMKESNLDPTEEDIQQIYNILDNMYYFDATPSAISNIITEEVKGVFEGSVPAEKAAENIQNRVALFLNEM